MTLVAGTRLGPYEIVGALGAGGMGEVYRAHDDRLGRDVALKVLPADLTGDAGRLERFDREARAIAALNHPHIVTIYSTEDAGGVRFMTMELVEGQTLAASIVGGGLPVARFLEIAIPLADALTAAHQKQITHRDLKPGNVMLSRDGRVKVLDFGLARVGGGELYDDGAATRAALTHQGTIVGTMPYMSPEQVEGKAIDPRSDLFSLGVIFYELLSGERPFKGASAPALMSAILRDTPSRIGERPGVPDGLDRLVARLLEKRPEDRVQTARDVFNELRYVQQQLESGRERTGNTGGAASHAYAGRAGSDAGAGAAFSINVMPLKPTPADGDAATLADGLSQGMVVALSRFTYLRVVDRPSTAEAPRIGYVLHGTVQASAAVARVVIQLTEASTGTSLWAETYDRDLREASLFNTQDALRDTIVASIADTSGALVRAMATTVRHQPVATLTPYEAVLRRLAYFSQMSPAEHAEVRDALEHAVTVAPTDATAWAALAGIYVDEHAQTFNPRPAPLDRARAAADRAVDIDASHPFAYAALAMIAFFRSDIGAFRPARDRAIALNPLDTGCLAYMGALTAYSGDWETGLAMCERAMLLNPHHPGVYRIPSVNDRYGRRDYRGALELLNQVNMPGYPNGLVMRAAIYGQLGRLDEGRTLAREAESRVPGITRATSDVRRKWLPSALVDHIQEGLDKLERDDDTTTVRPPHPAAAPSIAVLPFANMSADKDSEYFSDGLAEEIINTLARMTDVKVTARTSAFSFRGKDVAVEEIGRRLNVEHILEGSVRRAGDRIRVTAQLVKAADGFRVWSDRYDRELTDVFAIQDEMATAIAAQLKVQLARPALPRRTPHLGAYEAFLQSRHHWYKLTPAAIEKSRELVERALALDPGYADAYVGLGAYYFGVAWFGGADPREALPKSRAAMLKALELDPDSADAHAGAGAVRGILDFDWEAAGAHHRRALSLDRSPHVVLPHALWYLRPLGRLDEARVDLEGLCDRDPLAAFPRSELAHVLLLMRRYEEAAAAAEQALTLEPDYLLAAFTLLTARCQQQRLDEALAIAERIIVVSGRWSIPLAYLGLVYAADGRIADARAVLDDMMAPAGRTHTNATALATMYTALGEIDEAVRWLERAIEQREPIISTLATWPIFDAVRSHPLYPDLLRSMRLPDSEGLTPRSPSGRG